jgi:hypothetical protein
MIATPCSELLLGVADSGFSFRGREAKEKAK